MEVSQVTETTRQPFTPPTRRAIYYVLSFAVPLAGIVLGAVYLTRGDAAGKKFGKTCIIFAVAAVGVCLICYLLHLFGFVNTALG